MIKVYGTMLRRFLGSLRKDWGSFLLSLVLALIVWIIAVQQEDPLITRPLPNPVPIAYTNMPQGEVILGTPPERVELVVRGPRSVVEGLTASSFLAQVDLSGLKPGMRELTVQVSKSPSVDIVEQKPQKVTLHLEPLARKVIHVDIFVVDQPPAGYIAYSERGSTEPVTVTISGPESQVSQVVQVVAQVYLNGAKQTVTRKSVLSARDVNGQPVFGVKADPSVVSVVVPVEQKPGYLDLPVVVKTQGKPAAGYWLRSVSVEPAVVTLKGSALALKALSGYVETVPLDLGKADKDIVERLALVLPQNVSAVNTKSVSVEVKISPIEGGKTIQRVPRVQGLNEGLALNSTLSPVTIVLAGPVPKLSNLSVDDVSLVVDLSNITSPGAYTVRPTVVVPKGVVVQSMVPPEVKVEIVVLPATVTPLPTETITMTQTAVVSVTLPVSPTGTTQP